jgi:hypothetical protein
MSSKAMKSVLISRVVWYQEWFNIKSGLISRVFWYQECFGIKSVLISRVVWYHEWFDIKSGLISGVFWYQEWFDIKSGLISRHAAWIIFSQNMTLSERNLETRLAGHLAHPLDYKMAVLPFIIYCVSRTTHLTMGMFRWNRENNNGITL